MNKSIIIIITLIILTIIITTITITITINRNNTLSKLDTNNTINEELQDLNLTNTPNILNQKIFVISNANQLANKNYLWQNLVKKYGRDKASKMAPFTYVLFDKNDMELFNKEYDVNKLYILKKNIQRQEGLKITNDKDTILNGINNEYVVVQELLQDPYILHDRKINMRFYVLIICQNNKLTAYVHMDGFMYYTRMPFIKNSLEEGPNITSGYIDRWIYKINPLTHDDFRNYLDDPTRNLTKEEQNIKINNNLSIIVFNKIYNLLKDIIYSVSDSLCNNNSKFINNTTFQLFGVDVALNNKLDPQIMEFNIGPNLNTHDERDSILKHKVVEDMFKTINLTNNNNNRFVQIIM